MAQNITGKTGAASGIGAAALALLAHVPCCGLNLAMVFGATGVGAGFFHALAPYRPWILGFSLALAAWTLWTAFRPCSCTECRSRRSQIIQRVASVGIAALAVSGFFLGPAGHDHGHEHEPASVASRS